jgi:hypothetical protein
MKGKMIFFIKIQDFTIEYNFTKLKNQNGGLIQDGHDFFLFFT